MMISVVRVRQFWAAKAHFIAVWIDKPSLTVGNIVQKYKKKPHCECGILYQWVLPTQA